MFGYATSRLDVAAAAVRSSASTCSGAVQFTPTSWTWSLASTARTQASNGSPCEAVASSLQLNDTHTGLPPAPPSSASTSTIASASRAHGTVSNARRSHAEAARVRSRGRWNSFSTARVTSGAYALSNSLPSARYAPYGPIEPAMSGAGREPGPSAAFPFLRRRNAARAASASRTAQRSSSSASAGARPHRWQPGCEAW